MARQFTCPPPIRPRRTRLSEGSGRAAIVKAPAIPPAFSPVSDEVDVHGPARRHQVELRRERNLPPAGSTRVQYYAASGQENSRVRERHLVITLVAKTCLAGLTTGAPELFLGATIKRDKR